MDGIERLSVTYLAQWDERANIRKRDRYAPEPGFSPDGIINPVALPYLGHPLAAPLDEAGRGYLKLQMCYELLEEIARGEAEVVGHVCTELAMQEGELLLPEAARQALLCVAIDEGYHALASRELVGRLEELSGIAGDRPVREPGSIHPVRCGLAAAQEACDPALRPALKLVAVALMEHTVTDEIVAFMRGNDAESPFYLFNKEHLQDEARHRAFFRRVLADFWSGLDEAERRELAGCLPRFIHPFLLAVTRDDTATLERQLVVAGLEPEAAREVASDRAARSFDPAKGRYWYNMKTCMKDCGLLAEQELREGLHEVGLLDREELPAAA